MVDGDTVKMGIDTSPAPLRKPLLEVFLQAINAVPRRLHEPDFGVDYVAVHCAGVVHSAFGYFYDDRYAPGLFCEAEEVVMEDATRAKVLPRVTAAPVNAMLTCLMCIAEHARHDGSRNGS